MDWYTIGYALACVLVPVAWGLVVVWASNHIEARVMAQARRKGRGGKRAAVRPIEYHI